MTEAPREKSPKRGGGGVTLKESGEGKGPMSALNRVKRKNLLEKGEGMSGKRPPIRRPYQLGWVMANHQKRKELRRRSKATIS